MKRKLESSESPLEKYQLRQIWKFHHYSYIPVNIGIPSYLWPSQ